jgi:hypothetical protein
MNFTIKSRKTGEIFSFYAPDNGGYVHESPHLVAPVLRFAGGGGFMGSTLYCVLLRTIWPVLPVNGTTVREGAAQILNDVGPVF